MSVNENAYYLSGISDTSNFIILKKFSYITAVTMQAKGRSPGALCVWYLLCGDFLARYLFFSQAVYKVIWSCFHFGRSVTVINATCEHYTHFRKISGSLSLTFPKEFTNSDHCLPLLPLSSHNFLLEFLRFAT